MKEFMLKVFINKRNGQARVHLPKKELSKIPDRVKISIDKAHIRRKKDDFIL